MILYLGTEGVLTYKSNKWFRKELGNSNINNLFSFLKIFFKKSQLILTLNNNNNGCI